MSSMSLANKSLVIVGGTSGLGLAAARACVRAGARVVAVGRDPQKGAAVAQELGEAVRVLAADATDSTTADKAIALAVSEFGGFHGLYHVAGGSGRRPVRRNSRPVCRIKRRTRHTARNGSASTASARVGAAGKEARYSRQAMAPQATTATIKRSSNTAP